MKDFEKNLSELEKIVGKLESPELPLAEAIELFDKGVSLTKKLQEDLNAAEGKLKILGEEENAEF